MALNKFNSHNFNKKIIFGTTKKIRDENDGSTKMVFKSLTEPFFCAPVIRTIHQTFEAEGTKFQGTRQVGVNHQWVGKKITREMKLAKIDQKIYRIIDNSPNESDNPSGVDIIILQLADDVEDADG